MKHYLLEPTYKKSVVEYTAFRRKDEDGTQIWLRKELGWRYGSWTISVPENEEECMEYLESKGYVGDDAVFNWAMDYGHTMTDPETKEEVLDPDTSLLELVTSQMLPSETDDFVDITEDYEHAEMIETWDGCWEYWTVSSYQKEIDEDEQEAILEGVQEAYDEEYEEGVEDLGWTYVDTYYEMHCSPKITPCHDDGTPIEVEENA
jgi:hypothetical protein